MAWWICWSNGIEGQLGSNSLMCLATNWLVLYSARDLAQSTNNHDVSLIADLVQSIYK